jgi:hypothetical protein
VHGAGGWGPLGGGAWILVEGGSLDTMVLASERPDPAVLGADLRGAPAGVVLQLAGSNGGSNNGVPGR